MELDELKIIAGREKFNIEITEKDYLVTYLLYLLKDVKGIHFKGGTAINKILLGHQRLSEDLDFTVAGNLEDIEKEIKTKLKATIFNKVTHDKRVEGFTRLIVHYRLFHEDGTIFIDLNKRAKLLLKPELRKIPNFYKGQIPDFQVSCLSTKELIAEKIMAVCGRYRPRDYFDLYYIVKRKLPVDISLIKRKFKSVGLVFAVPLMFKNANKIFNQWKDDMFMLTKTRPDYKEVMKTLADYFKLKEEKEKLKSSIK